MKYSIINITPEIKWKWFEYDKYFYVNFTLFVTNSFKHRQKEKDMFGVNIFGVFHSFCFKSFNWIEIFLFFSTKVNHFFLWKAKRYIRKPKGYQLDKITRAGRQTKEKKKFRLEVVGSNMINNKNIDYYMVSIFQK